MKKGISLFLLGIGAIMLFAIPVMALHGETSRVQWFSDWSNVSMASSNLRTYDWGASFNLNTYGLKPMDAVTVWWVIFNYPEYCTHGTGGYRCGEGDLAPFGGNSSVESSVVHADGDVIDYRGFGHFQGNLMANDASKALFGNGLVHPEGADIHFVVRSHGRVWGSLVREQLNTFGGGCNNAPPGTGMPGPNTCWDAQFSVHEQWN